MAFSLDDQEQEVEEWLLYNNPDLYDYFFSEDNVTVSHLNSDITA